METPHTISESMVRLKNSHSTLRNTLGLASEDVVGIRGVVRWNHNEFTFPTHRHEVMLFTDNRYNKTSHLTEFINETWLRCDSGWCSGNDLIQAGCTNILTVGSMCVQYERIRIAFLGDSLTRGNALHEVTRRGPVHVEGRGNFPLRIQEVARQFLERYKLWPRRYNCSTRMWNHRRRIRRHYHFRFGHDVDRRQIPDYARYQ